MRAVQVTTFGGPEELVSTRVPDPVAGPGQVLIAVSTADVMFLDTLIRSGWGQDYFAVAPPYVPGAGVAGVVSSVGDGVDPAWIGRAVVTGTGERDRDGRSTGPTGGYAERAVVPAAALIPIPEATAHREAVALLHDGPTALQLLDVADVHSGDWVLVTAAAGGAGVLLVQLLHARGTRVIGAARGARKLALVRELGAEAVLDYAEVGWTDRVRTTTGGRGVEVVLDGAGGQLGEQAFEAIAPGGRFITYGSSGGDFAEIDPQRAAKGGVRITGLLDLPSLDLEARKTLIGQALAEAASGRIRPIIGQTFPLAQAGKAHAAIAARTTLGKTLLEI
ncbi:MAG: zinc-binding dehydrogenase [Pseudonocardia sp.]